MYIQFALKLSMLHSAPTIFLQPLFQSWVTQPVHDWVIGTCQTPQSVPFSFYPCATAQIYMMFALMSSQRIAY